MNSVEFTHAHSCRKIIEISSAIILLSKFHAHGGACSVDVEQE